MNTAGKIRNKEMNKIQKSAWFNLIAFLFDIGILIYLFVTIFVMKRRPGTVDLICVTAAVIILLVVMITSFRRKQSPKEPDSDERDKLIQLKAVLAAFVSVGILLVAALIPRFIIGLAGKIEVWVLAFINVVVFLIAMLVYCVAVLIQYGRANKGVENE